MGIERIILGDDNLGFARKAMPFIPGAEVEFVDTPDAMLERVASAAQEGAPYSIIISDYDYGAGRMDGLALFATMQARGDAATARRILWTGNAGDESVREGAARLGLELLDKDELGSLVGMAVSKAPLKEDGEILLYIPGKAVYRDAIRQMVDILMPGGITVSDDLKGELRTGRYGLVLDGSTLGKKEGPGAVAHDMKYLELPAVPKVVCLRHYGRELADIAEALIKYRRS